MRKFLTLIIPLGVCSLFNAGATRGAEQRHHNDLPSSLSVYSKDGRESLWVRCLRKTPGTSEANEITCSFVKIEFERATEVTAFMEDMNKTKETKEFWDFVSKTLQDDSPETKAMWSRVCSPELRERLEAGPKMRQFAGQILKACSNKDFIAALKSSVDLEKRTCNVVVDSFALDFQRIGKGRWFNQSRPSALLCNILKVYELRGEESEWTLTETRLSGDTEGACEVIKNEIGKTTVWTSNKLRNTYELPCDFVVHKLFRFPDEKFRYIPTQ